MRDSIKKILEMGGTISFPYKIGINEWFGEIKISTYKNRFIISPRSIEFFDIDECVNYFCSEALSSKNYGYVQERLSDKGMITDNDEYDLEKPTNRIKKLFKEESILVDHEFSLMNIIVKPFPTKEEAENELEIIMVNYTYVDSLKNLLDGFNYKYSMIDIHMSFRAKYKYGDGKDYSSGFKLSSLNDENILKYKDMSHFKDKTTVFDGFELSVSISNNDNYKIYELNI